MKIIAARVIRPKDRSSKVLATVELTLDTGIKLLNMHLLTGKEEGDPPILKMPHLQSASGSVRSVYNPVTKGMRADMTRAANAALAAAQEAGKNDFTVTFEKMEEYREPKYSNIRVHWFDNDKPVRAFVSLLMDDSVVLNRLAVVRDLDTQMLTVRIPNHKIQNNRRTVSYYRIQGAAYDKLYKEVMEAYAARPAADDEAASA